MRRGMRFVVVVGVIICLVAIPLGVGCYVYWRNLGALPLSLDEGELTVAGLERPVEILRDAYGVPHIYAENSHDLFFAQGYAQAQDRWFQMDLMRHAASGTLGELVGRNAPAIENDVLARTLDFRPIAEREYDLVSDEGKAILEAFTAGVNAYVGARTPRELALEYSVLALTGVESPIAPWTPVDCLVVNRVLALDLSKNRTKELIRAALVERLGNEMTGGYMPPWPYDERSTIVTAAELGQADGAALRTGVRPGPSSTTLAMLRDSLLYNGMFFGEVGANGSNNWVVSGDLTATGDPILANDPHLGISLPSIWYEVGLHAPGYDARGFALPVAPLVVIGHNGAIGWGMTNGGSDCQDHYGLKLNPDAPHQYEWDGAWRDLELREETIRFGDGSAPLRFQVRVSHLGPIVNENTYIAGQGRISGHNVVDPLALKWTGSEPTHQFDAELALNRAGDWDAFVDALSGWETPSQNFVYADKAGNIGYVFAGKVPVRRKPHDGRVPAPGWDSHYEWAAYIPYGELPKVFNPSRGYVATANQAVVPPSWAETTTYGRNPEFNVDLNSDTEYYAYRGGRINTLIERTVPHTVEASKIIQRDIFSESARDTIPFIMRVAYGENRLDATRDWLINWDHQFRPESPYAAFYGMFWQRLMKNLFDDDFFGDIAARGASQEMWSVRNLLRDPENRWWDDTQTDVVETRDDIVKRSFIEAHDAMEERFGPYRRDWRWDGIHTVTYRSMPLGRSGVAPIEWAVNRGPYGVGGSTETLNRMRWTTDRNNFDVYNVPSMRMVLDMGDLTRSAVVNSTGQSGHPYSPHYDDQIPLYLSGKYRPMHWTRINVERGAETRQILRPAMTAEEAPQSEPTL